MDVTSVRRTQMRAARPNCLFGRGIRAILSPAIGTQGQVAFSSSSPRLQSVTWSRFGSPAYLRKLSERVWKLDHMVNTDFDFVPRRARVGHLGAGARPPSRSTWGRPAATCQLPATAARHSGGPTCGGRSEASGRGALLGSYTGSRRWTSLAPPSRDQKDQLNRCAGWADG